MCRLALLPANPQHATRPAAQRSTDGGKNWVSANAAPKAPLYAVAVPPGSTTTAWALGGPCESRQPWDDGCRVCPVVPLAAGL